MSNNCLYTVKNGVLNIKTDLFSFNFLDVESAQAETDNCDGLSKQFLKIKATGKCGVRHYCVWDDLPLVYMPDYREEKLLELQGEHWIIKNVKLNAFTDDNDTLTNADESYLFARSLFSEKCGEIFFLENPQDGNAIVIISETPDYQTAVLNIKKGVVTVENGSNGLALGFCKNGECEALCRNYYRHARNAEALVDMSNTWGDMNGTSRVCRDFVMREIDAAEKIGVDIVQIDDGWQKGGTYDPKILDADGKRCFNGDFWEISKERFPNGMREIADYAKAKNVKLGLWLAPDSHGNFALLERDKAVLRKAYEEWGIRFFKLDMYWIHSDIERDRFIELLQYVYSFGKDVAVQLDVTREDRINYLCARQYGTVFVENRYTHSANSFPHRVLRNIWSIGRYIPTSKFQFELVNPDLFTECYQQNDPFVPSLYDMDYLFAITMLSNPLFWMELQFLPQKRIDELKRIMPVWKSLKEEFSKCDVMPIGDLPCGRSFTGFLISDEKSPKYLLLFREVTEDSKTVIKAPVKKCDASVLVSNADVNVNVNDGFVEVDFSKPRAYALIKL